MRPDTRTGEVTFVRWHLARRSLLIPMLWALALSTACRSQTAFPGDTWLVRPAHVVGLDSEKLNRVVERLSQRRGAAGVIVKDGFLVRTWGEPTRRVDWASGAKVVLSTMLLFARHEGRLSSVHDRIAPWGWDTRDPARQLRGKDRWITFFHLANMTSGFDRIEPPGAAFAYNDNAVQLYAQTLLRVFDVGAEPGGFNAAALAPTRLGALRLEDGPLFGISDPQRAMRAETGVVTSPRDFARIGWLWLNRGRWANQQLLPEAYFEELGQPLVPSTLPLSIAGTEKYLLIGSFGNASTFGVPFGPGLYGMNWWFNGEVGPTGRRHWPDAPPDTFAAIGHYPDKAMLIIPSLRMVVAAEGTWGDLEARPPDAGRGQPDRFWDPGEADAPMNQILRALVDAAG